MQANRGNVLETALRRLVSILGAPAAAAPEHFLHILAWTAELLEVAQAFDAEGTDRVRSTLGDLCSRLFASYHHQNRELLASMLERERWKGFESDLGGAGLPALDRLLASLATAREGRKQLAFAEYMALGNPFSAAAGGGVATAAEVAHRAAQESRDARQLHFTATSVKVLQLLGTYAALADSLRDPRFAAVVVEGFAQIFHLFFFSVFKTFGDTRILLPEGAGDASVTPRLRQALLQVHVALHPQHQRSASDIADPTAASQAPPVPARQSFLAKFGAATGVGRPSMQTSSSG